MGIRKSVSSEDVLQTLGELDLSLNSKLPYHLDKMFPRLRGWGAKAEIKARVKLLNEADLVLPRMLFPKEEVIFVSQGVQNSRLESITLGAMFSSIINRCLLVMTNARLIIAHCNSSGRISEPCWMIYYSEIKTFHRRLTGSIGVTLRKGERFHYSGLSKVDRKIMPLLFRQTAMKHLEHGFRPKCTQSRENLCSHCYSVVPVGTFKCPECGTEYWKPSQLAFRSLTLPSWGNLLMKHYPLVVVELFFYSIFLFLVFESFQRGEVGKAAFPLVLFHAFDAGITRLVARKGLHSRHAGEQIEEALNRPPELAPGQRPRLLP